MSNFPDTTAGGGTGRGSSSLFQQQLNENQRRKRTSSDDEYVEKRTTARKMQKTAANAVTNWDSFMTEIQNIDSVSEYKHFDQHASAFVFEGVCLRLLRDNDRFAQDGTFHGALSRACCGSGGVAGGSSASSFGKFGETSSNLKPISMELGAFSPPLAPDFTNNADSPPLPSSIAVASSDKRIQAMCNTSEKMRQKRKAGVGDELSVLSASGKKMISRSLGKNLEQNSVHSDNMQEVEFTCPVSIQECLLTNEENEVQLAARLVDLVELTNGKCCAGFVQQKLEKARIDMLEAAKPQPVVSPASGEGAAGGAQVLNPNVIGANEEQEGEEEEEDSEEYESESENLAGEPCRFLDFDNLPPPSPKRTSKKVSYRSSCRKPNCDDSILGPVLLSSRKDCSVKCRKKPPKPKLDAEDALLVDVITHEQEQLFVQLQDQKGGAASAGSQAISGRQNLLSQQQLQGCKRIFDPERMTKSACCVQKRVSGNFGSLEEMQTFHAQSLDSYTEDLDQYLIGYEDGLPTNEQLSHALLDELMCFFLYVLQKHGALANFYLVEKLGKCFAHFAEGMSSVGGGQQAQLTSASTSASSAVGSSLQHSWVTNFLLHTQDPQYQDKILPACLDQILDIGFEFSAVTQQPGGGKPQLTTKLLYSHFISIITTFLNSPLIKLERPGLLEKILIGFLEPEQTGTRQFAEDIFQKITTNHALQYLSDLIRKELFTVEDGVCLYCILAFECLKLSPLLAEQLIPLLLQSQVEKKQDMLLATKSAAAGTTSGRATTEEELAQAEEEKAVALEQRCLLTDLLANLMVFYGEKLLTTSVDTGCSDQPVVPATPLLGGPNEQIGGSSSSTAVNFGLLAEGEGNATKTQQLLTDLDKVDHRMKRIFLNLSKSWIDCMGDVDLQERALAFLPKFVVSEFYLLCKQEPLTAPAATATAGAHNLSILASCPPPNTGMSNMSRLGELGRTVMSGLPTGGGVPNNSSSSRLHNGSASSSGRSLEKCLWMRIHALLMDPEEAPRAVVCERMKETVTLWLDWYRQRYEEVVAAATAPAGNNGGKTNKKKKRSTTSNMPAGAVTHSTSTGRGSGCFASKIKAATTVPELLEQMKATSFMPYYVLKRLTNRLLDKKRPVRKVAMQCAKLFLNNVILLDDRSIRDSLVENCFSLYALMKESANEVVEAESLIFCIERNLVNVCASPLVAGSNPAGAAAQQLASTGTSANAAAANMKRRQGAGATGSAESKDHQQTLLCSSRKACFLPSVIKLPDYTGFSVYARRKRLFTAETKAILENVERDHWELQEHRAYSKHTFREIWKTFVAFFGNGGPHICNVVSTCRDCLVGRQDWWLVSKSAFFQDDLRQFLTRQATAAQQKPASKEAALLEGEEMEEQEDLANIKNAAPADDDPMDVDFDAKKDADSTKIKSEEPERKKPLKITAAVRKKYERNLAAFCDLMARACSAHCFGDWLNKNTALGDEDEEELAGDGEPHLNEEGEPVDPSDQQNFDVEGALEEEVKPPPAKKAKKMQRKNKSKLELAEEIDLFDENVEQHEQPNEESVVDSIVDDYFASLEDNLPPIGGVKHATGVVVGTSAAASSSSTGNLLTSSCRPNKRVFFVDSLIDFLANTEHNESKAAKEVEKEAADVGLSNGVVQEQMQTATAEGGLAFDFSGIDEDKIVRFLELMAQIAPQTLARSCGRLVQKREKTSAGGGRDSSKGENGSPSELDLNKYMRILGRVGSFCIKTGFRNFEELTHEQIEQCLPVLKHRPDLVCKFLKFVRGMSSADLFEGVLKSILNYVRKKSPNHNDEDGGGGSNLLNLDQDHEPQQKKNKMKKLLQETRSANHRIVMATKLLKFLRSQQRVRSIYFGLDENQNPVPLFGHSRTTGVFSGQGLSLLPQQHQQYQSSHQELGRNSSFAAGRDTGASRPGSSMVGANLVSASQQENLDQHVQAVDPLQEVMNWKKYRDIWNDVVFDITSRANTIEQLTTKLQQEAQLVQLNFFAQLGDLPRLTLALQQELEADKMLVAKNPFLPNTAVNEKELGKDTTAGAVQKAAALATVAAGPPQGQSATAVRAVKKGTGFRAALQALLCANQYSSYGTVTNHNTGAQNSIGGSTLNNKSVGGSNVGLSIGGHHGGAAAAASSSQQNAASSSSTNQQQQQTLAQQQDKVIVDDFTRSGQWTSEEEQAFLKAKQVLKRYISSSIANEELLVDDFLWWSRKIQRYCGILNIAKLAVMQGLFSCLFLCEVSSDQTRKRDFKNTMDNANNVTAKIQSDRQNEDLAAKMKQTSSSASAGFGAASTNLGNSSSVPDGIAAAGTTSANVLVSAAIPTSSANKSRKQALHKKLQESQTHTVMRVLQLVQLPETKSTLLSRICIGILRGYASFVEVNNFDDTERFLQCVQTLFARFHWTKKQLLTCVDYVAEKRGMSDSKKTQFQWIKQVFTAISQE
ncbi:unnamed protein product [Amoebophrya sp. A120]|nr:unnamed protein product [Amoebophrya sp. A120]|eukprot:GSA120T00004132001.1